MKVILLYLKYDKSAANVIHELGYPDRKTLKSWYNDYIKEQETGVFWERDSQLLKYSDEKKKAAIEHFLDHGCNISRTVRMLGYPSRPTLRNWCEELTPWIRKKYVGGIQYSQEEKHAAVLDLCTRVDSVQNVADKYSAARETLYRWKNSLLSKEVGKPVKKKKDSALSNDKDLLLSEIDSLKQQIRRLRLEKDILEGTADIIKKDPGGDPKNLTNREKASLIGALRNDYPLNELIAHLEIVRSSYFYHRKIELMPNKYDKLRNRIVKLFEENKKRYGYRRIHALLLREGTRISEKVVRRIMSESNLIVASKRKRKYSSYQGENCPAAINLIKRDFHADAPNMKWLTDITEFRIPAGKVYLSPIVDCFDGLLPSWTMSTSPNAELVNSMLDNATKTLKQGKCPIIHSDRGGHYRWPGWIARTKKAGITRSMSRKGCPPDNAACEGVFGRIKNEMFYNRSWTGVSVDEFIIILNDYLIWYNEKRIKMSLGAMSPLEYRCSLGLAV